MCTRSLSPVGGCSDAAIRTSFEVLPPHFCPYIYFAARPYLCVDVKELSCRSLASLQVVGGLHTFLPLNEPGVCGISMSYLIYKYTVIWKNYQIFELFFEKNHTYIIGYF